MFLINYHNIFNIISNEFKKTEIFKKDLYVMKQRIENIISLKAHKIDDNNYYTTTLNGNFIETEELIKIDNNIMNILRFDPINVDDVKKKIKPIKKFKLYEIQFLLEDKEALIIENIHNKFNRESNEKIERLSFLLKNICILLEQTSADKLFNLQKSILLEKENFIKDVNKYFEYVHKKSSNIEKLMDSINKNNVNYSDMENFSKKCVNVINVDLQNVSEKTENELEAFKKELDLILKYSENIIDIITIQDKNIKYNKSFYNLTITNKTLGEIHKEIEKIGLEQNININKKIIKTFLRIP